MSASPAGTPAVESPLREFAGLFFRSPAANAGLVLILFVVLLSVLGPFLHAVDPNETVNAPFLPPFEEWSSPLGTDYIGRDVLAGIVNGGLATLSVGAMAALMAIFIGVVLGSLAGYYGGAVDVAVMRVTEFFQVLPALLFAMVLMTIFAPSLTTMSLSIGLVMWPSTARLARGEFLRLRGQDYVRAEQVMAASDLRIIWRIILPNALPPLIVAAALAVGVSILFEAGLSFLGLGDPSARSWGEMIGSNRNYIYDCPWAVIFPGIAIFATVLGVTLLGDGVNDALNPRLRER